MLEFMLYLFATIGVLCTTSTIFFFWLVRDEIRSVEDINPVIDLDDLK